MISIILIQLWLSQAQAKTLVLIGGGQRPKEALSAFVAAKKAGPVFVLPFGTSEPRQSFDNIVAELGALGASDVRCLCRDRLSASDRSALEQAGALYFPGGDQNKIMQRLRQENLESLVRQRYQQHVPVAGTSAGTAIQSNPMLTGNGSELAPGLGLLAGVLLDQHFLKRARQERLLNALKHQPSFIGIGIDEDMSLVVNDDRWLTALGPSQVNLYFPEAKGRFRLVELHHGETQILGQ